MEGEEFFRFLDGECALGRVSMVGQVVKRCGYSFEQMRTLGVYSLLYIVSGQGEFRDGLGGRYEVTGGDSLLLFPEVAHGYEPHGQWHELFLLFDGPLFRLLQQQGLLNPATPHLRLQPQRLWQPRIEGEVQRFAHSGSVDEGALLRFAQLLCEMVAPTRTPDSWLLTAQQLVGERLEAAADWVGIAAALGCSYESFRKRFRALAAVSPSAYRIGCKVRHACHYLEMGLDSPTIAQKLDFADEFHFAKTFKKLSGMTPRQFRLLQR
jgi:AraC-like DNA-binding protein